MHEGEYEGEIMFKNDKFCLIFPLFIKVHNTKQIQTIKVKSTIRVSRTICIQLANQTNKSIEYNIICEKDYLECADKIVIPAKSELPLTLRYTPIFIGSRSVELKLYNESAN